MDWIHALYKNIRGGRASTGLCVDESSGVLIGPYRPE